MLAVFLFAYSTLRSQGQDRDNDQQDRAQDNRHRSQENRRHDCSKDESTDPHPELTSTSMSCRTDFDDPADNKYRNQVRNPERQANPAKEIVNPVEYKPKQTKCDNSNYFHQNASLQPKW